MSANTKVTNRNELVIQLMRSSGKRNIMRLDAGRDLSANMKSARLGCVAHDCVTLVNFWICSSLFRFAPVFCFIESIREQSLRFLGKRTHFTWSFRCGLSGRKLDCAKPA